MTVKGFDTQVTSADHSDLHDLRFDLAEAGLQASLAGAFGDQDPGRTHDRIDDIAHPQRELLHPPAHAGTDDRLFQLHFGLGQRGFGAGLLGRENGRDSALGGLFCGGGGSDRAQAAFHSDLELLDVAQRERYPDCAVAAPAWSPVRPRPAGERSWPPESGLQPSRYRPAPPPSPPRPPRSCAARSPQRPPASSCPA